MKKEALKIMDIYELKERQMMLDNKFKEKMKIKKLSPKSIKIAYLDELGELIHELKPLWCYWKKDNKPVNKRRVLEELSDCLHFALSYENNKGHEAEIIFTVFTNEPQRLEKSIKKLTKIKNIFSSIYHILIALNYTIEEFLEVHHQVWLRNMNIRTGDDY